MKDLGKEAAKLYDHPSMPQTPANIIYPSQNVPLMMFDKEPEVGDEVEYTVKAIVRNIHKDEYCKECRVDMIQGEAKKTTKSLMDEGE